MNSQVGFISKIIIASALLAVLIKYGGVFLTVTPNSTNALIAILLPFFVLSFLLSWRAIAFQPKSQSVGVKK